MKTLTGMIAMLTILALPLAAQAGPLCPGGAACGCSVAEDPPCGGGPGCTGETGPGCECDGPGECDCPFKGEKGAKMREKMKQFRGKVLREKLGLPEDRAAKVEAVLDGFMEQRHKLKEEMHAEMKTVKELLKSESNDMDAYETAVTNLMAVRTKMEALHTQQFEELREILNPKEQAKVLLALRKMHRKAKGKFRGGKGRKGGKGGKHRGGHGPNPKPFE